MKNITLSRALFSGKLHDGDKMRYIPQKHNKVILTKSETGFEEEQTLETPEYVEGKVRLENDQYYFIGYCCIRLNCSCTRIDWAIENLNKICSKLIDDVECRKVDFYTDNFLGYMFDTGYWDDWCLNIDYTFKYLRNIGIKSNTKRDSDLHPICGVRIRICLTPNTMIGNDTPFRIQL